MCWLAELMWWIYRRFKFVACHIKIFEVLFESAYLVAISLKFTPRLFAKYLSCLVIAILSHFKFIFSILFCVLKLQSTTAQTHLLSDGRRGSVMELVESSTYAID